MSARTPALPLLAAILLAAFPSAQAEPPIPKAVALHPVQPMSAPSSDTIPPHSSITGEPITVTSVLVSEPYIAITFDDGPSAANTPKLLKMLRDRNIKATFFVIGENAAEHPEILKMVSDEGHEIGNHSWSHPNLAKYSDDRVREELRKTDDVIYQVTQKPCTLFRPPYGSLTKDQQKWVHDEFGYTIVLWSVDPLDWKRPGSSIVAERIVSHTGKGSIVLAHDIHSATVAAMPSTLDRLLAKGFKFVTVSELLQHRIEEPASVAKADPVQTATATTTAQ